MSSGKPPPQPSARPPSPGAGRIGLRAFAERHGLPPAQAERASQKYGEHIEHRIADALHQRPGTATGPPPPCGREPPEDGPSPAPHRPRR